MDGGRYRLKALTYRRVPMREGMICSFPLTSNPP
jgi:hypothetical protein